MVKYVPKRGDIIWLTLDPIAGHEQAGRRPVLVLSEERYNKLLGLAIIVPITRAAKGYATEVPVCIGGKDGVILSDQVRSVGYRERKADFLARASDSIVETVIGRLKAIIDIA